jgi:hypothetical protein
VAAPGFVKNPKFIGAAIVVLWVAYVIYWNHRLNPIDIQLLPFLKPLQLNVSTVILGAAIFGSILTLAVQFLWRRGRSKSGSVAPAASAAPPGSTRTVA